MRAAGVVVAAERQPGAGTGWEEGGLQWRTFLSARTISEERLEVELYVGLLVFTFTSLL